MLSYERSLHHDKIPQIYAEAIQYLKTLGLSKIHIRVEATNKTAIQVYKELGFEFISTADE